MLGIIDRMTSGVRSGFRALSVLAAAGTMAIAGMPADAAIIGTLTHTQPTGVAGPNDTIDIYVKFALDPSSVALTTDASHNITSGMTDTDWLSIGIDPTKIGFTYLNVFFECSGDFTTVCNEGPPYNFDFAPVTIDPSNFDLQPGESIEFLFGSFTPSAGPVAPGTYTWYNMGVTANALDENGDPFLDDEGNRLPSFTLAETCPQQNPACAFTRTVVGVSAVPEPASWALMIGGFALVGAAIRRGTMAMRFT
jgi:hypothetical protein